MRTGEWVVVAASWTENWRRGSTTVVRGVAGDAGKMRTGDLVVQLVVRGVAGELEAENWRLCSTTCSTRSNLWSWKLRTGDFVVQL